jgi:hypothetical protein
MSKLALASILVGAVAIASGPGEAEERKSLSSSVIEANEAQRQTPTLFGVACNNDFYVMALSVTGAFVGALISRGRGELGKVIITAAGDKLAERAAPRLCEVLAGTPTDLPSPPLNPVTRPNITPGGPDGSLDARIAELVKPRCPLGQTYNASLSACTDTAKALAPSNGPFTRPNITPLRPNSSFDAQITELVKRKCQLGLSACTDTAIPNVTPARPDGSLDAQIAELVKRSCPLGQTYNTSLAACSDTAIAAAPNTLPDISWTTRFDGRRAKLLGDPVARSLCPIGQFYSLTSKECVELKVVKECQPGERYSSILEKCVGVGLLDQRRLCGDNEYYSDFNSKCVKLSANPECPPFQFYSALREKCVPLTRSEPDDVVCKIGERKLVGVCIPIRQLSIKTSE